MVLAATVMVDRASASVVLRYFRAVRQGDGSIKVDWETASELGTTAFLLYRSENVNQVGTQIANVGAKGDGVTGGTYTYTDPASGLLPGRLYYYRLQEIATGGTSWYGPIAPSGGSFNNPATAAWTATPTDPPTATRRFTNTPVPPTPAPATPAPPVQPVVAVPQAPAAPVVGSDAVTTPTPAPQAAAPLPLLATDTPVIPTATPAPTSSNTPTVVASDTPRPSATPSYTPAPAVFAARTGGDVLPAATEIPAAAPLIASTEESGPPWGLLIGGLVLVGLALGLLALTLRRSGRA